MIYFIKAETGLIKIGYSSSPQKRLTTLQTGSPVSLELIAVIPGSIEDESRLHKRFRSSRDRGEWFLPSIELLDYLQNLPSSPKQKVTLSNHCEVSWRIEINSRKTKSGKIYHWVYRFGSGKNRQTVYGGMVQPWMMV